MVMKDKKTKHMRQIFPTDTLSDLLIDVPSNATFEVDSPESGHCLGCNAEYASDEPETIWAVWYV